MNDGDCLFCQIALGTEPGEKVWENDEFLCIKNKYPKAPVHLLVMPKSHIRKQEVATSEKQAFWGKILSAVFTVVKEQGLDKYKLVNNGMGYAHFEHEHIHILGGSSAEPGGVT